MIDVLKMFSLKFNWTNKWPKFRWVQTFLLISKLYWSIPSVIACYHTMLTTQTDMGQSSIDNPNFIPEVSYPDHKSPVTFGDKDHCDWTYFCKKKNIIYDQEKHLQTEFLVFLSKR